MVKISNEDFFDLLNKLKEIKSTQGFKDAEKEVISYIEAGRVNVNAVNNCGRSPLVICAKEGLNKVGKALLRNGADANLICTCNGQKQTALMFAIAEDNIEMVMSLLVYNADVNFETNNKNTPLMYAVNYTTDGIVNTLISSGTDLNAQNTDGDTALHQAIECDEQGFVRCLIRNGANSLIKNKNGKTAEDLIDEKIKKSNSDSDAWIEIKKEILSSRILNSRPRRINLITL